MMGGRRSSTIDRSVLAIAWLGMAGFVGLHSFLILSRNVGDPTVATFRISWFAGLGVVTAMLLYFGVRSRSTVDEG